MEGYQLKNIFLQFTSTTLNTFEADDYKTDMIQQR